MYLLIKPKNLTGQIFLPFNFSFDSDTKSSFRLCLFYFPGIYFSEYINDMNNKNFEQKFHEGYFTGIEKCMIEADKYRKKRLQTIMARPITSETTFVYFIF